MTKLQIEVKDEALKKAELLAHYAKKPIVRFLQLDAFTDVVGDSVMHPDEDGDCLMGGQCDELRSCAEVRVLIREGISDKEAIRCLKKLTALLRRGGECLRKSAYPDEVISLSQSQDSLLRVFCRGLDELCEMVSVLRQVLPAERLGRHGLALQMLQMVQASFQAAGDDDEVIPF